MAQTTPVRRFFAPPSVDDLSAMAAITLDHIPEDLRHLLGDIVLRVEEFPDEALIDAMGLDNPYDLFAYTAPANSVSGNHVAVILYRRPLLEYWCDQGEDLMHIVAQTIIDELSGFLGLTVDQTEALAMMH